MRHITRVITTATFALSALSVAPATIAATATGTFQVRVTIPSSCTVSATVLDFGSLDPTTATLPANNTSTVTVTCTHTTPYTIALNAGVNASGAFASRTMINGSYSIGYQLYIPAGVTIWGDGSTTPTATSTVPGTGTGIAQPYTVNGRISSLSNAAPGNYTDTVTVTLTYT